MNVQRMMVSVMALILVVGVTSSARAATMYSNNFDSLALGTDMYTVAGWSGGPFGTATVRHVSDVQSVSSPHSLSLNGPPATGGDPMVMINLSDAAILGQPAATGQWKITFDYWVGALGGFAEIPLDGSAGGWNQLTTTSPFNLQLLTGIDAGAWNSIVMDFDFDAPRSISVSADGNAPIVKLMNAGVDLGNFGFQPATSPGLFYVDNLNIAQVPEPATLAMLSPVALALVCIARSKRRK